MTALREYAIELESAVGAIVAELREQDRLTRASVDALRARLAALESEVWHGRGEVTTDDGS